MPSVLIVDGVWVEVQYTTGDSKINHSSFGTALSAQLRSLERFFREFRAKADEIGAFPNEQSCLALFFLVTQLDHAKHDRPSVANKS